MKKFLLFAIPIVALLSANLGVAADTQSSWWNPAWTQRQTLTLDPAAAKITENPGSTTVLIRLSDANFPFASARADGSDLRIIAADGKTQLAYQIESWDNLLNEAYVWVKLPGATPTTKEILHLYSGNPAPDAGLKATEAFDSDTTLVWHFAGRGAAPADTTGNNNNAAAPATTAEGSLIGNGLRLLANPVTLPESPSLEWKQSQTLTISTWIKPAALQENAILLSRGEGAKSLQILLNQGVPTMKLGGKTSPAASPVAANVWNHVAVVADGKTLQLHLNGELYATLDGELPALTSPITLGAVQSGYSGELDEFCVSKVARSASWIKLVAVNQGASDAAQRALSLGAVEGGTAGEQSHLMQHLSLFGDIANNMMFDGWIAIGVCLVMIVVGWTVAVKKFVYLNSIEKGTKVFLSQWKSLSTDLTALDPGDQSNVSSLGGQVAESDQALIGKSPLYHIYQIGSEEIRHRLAKDGSRVQGLSGRSIQAIRASLDAGLVHESHRLSDGLVYLTISIAGGPYVGLLGTVVGVMITFAIIAKSGEVNVNSIAPGIASALLATVVGLVVAIPALFIYSYLNGRIKNSLGLMQVFIDEFVAKMAEFYRPANESDPTSSGSSH
jgi:biopolymer transport protein ExbB